MTCAACRRMLGAEHLVISLVSGVIVGEFHVCDECCAWRLGLQQGLMVARRRRQEKQEKRRKELSHEAKTKGP